jgi:hypothetical protein
LILSRQNHRRRAVACIFLAAILLPQLSFARPVILSCRMDNGDRHRIIFDEQAGTVDGHQAGEQLAEIGPGKFMERPATQYRRHRVEITSKYIESFDGTEDVIDSGSRIYTSSTDLSIDRRTGEATMRVRDGVLNGAQTVEGNCETGAGKKQF